MKKNKKFNLKKILKIHQIAKKVKQKKNGVKKMKKMTMKNKTQFYKKLKKCLLIKKTKLIKKKKMDQVQLINN